MELLHQSEVSLIAKQCGYPKVIKWSFEEFQDKVIGYLGEHLNLIIEVDANEIKSQMKLFVKCMPRFDAWKAQYLKELLVFKKEYIMLNVLFKEFKNPEDSRKWRPKLLYIKEDIFVFENVCLQGYNMPHHQETMIFQELKACIAVLARFHAQSYIFEERKTKELKRVYRIWENYSEYLQEPGRGMEWRDTGTKAVIDFLKVFSKYKSKPNFSKYLECIVPGLYDKAIELMKPSPEYRNVVVHRDLWTNNIFLKKGAKSDYHALFVDFQTVLYSSPMIDLSSLIYFNTSRADRTAWTNELIDFYYDVLSAELKTAAVAIEIIINKDNMIDAYEKSIIFGITQASLIIPIIAMSKTKREEMYSSPESAKKANVVSRSNEFIEIAKEDVKYKTRVTELLDEIVERFVFPYEIGV